MPSKFAEGAKHTLRRLKKGLTMRSVNSDEISEMAHEIWLRRGSPEGSPDEDWLEAERRLEEGDDSELVQAA